MNNVLNVNFNQLRNSDYRIAFVIKSKPIIDLSKLVQSVSLPIITYNPVNLGYMTNNANLPADTPTFGEIDLELLVDDSMAIYSTVLDWSHRIRVASSDIPYAEITVELLDGYKKTVSSFTYKNVIPISIGNITLDNSSENEVILPVSMAFNGIEYHGSLFEKNASTIIVE